MRLNSKKLILIKMSFDKKEELYNYEMIYRADGKKQKLLYEIKEENNIFEIIYKRNENKIRKKKKLKEFKEYDYFYFKDDKEYSVDALRILDKYFIKNNKNKCKLIYKNKKFEIKEYFEEIENNYYKNKDIIKLKIYGINNISDTSRMFYGCYHLLSFSEYKNEQNINDLDNIYSEDNTYIFLKEEIESNGTRLGDNVSCLPNDLNKEYIESSLLNSSISNNNATDFFSKINSFKNNFIEISSIKKHKIFKMQKMFSGCFSLISVKGLSNWNICNVTDLSNIFHKCNSLISLPDISNWNTSSVTDMNHMFSGCNSLKSLPDISNWNTSNVTDMSRMFSGCKSYV